MLNQLKVASDYGTGWDDLLPPLSNIHYPLNLALNLVLWDNDETLPVSQWPGEVNDGIQHQNNIGIMLQHAKPRVPPLCLLNNFSSIYGADHWIWDPCV